MTSDLPSWRIASDDELYAYREHYERVVESNRLVLEAINDEIARRLETGNPWAGKFPAH